MLEVVADVLRRRGVQGWLVGGSVRDREEGRPSPDLDVAVGDDPAAVAREVAGRLKSPWFALSTRHGAYRVMAPGGHIDVAALRGGGIEEDLAQRDFTINAMAVPIVGPAGREELIDPFGGRTHLHQKRLVDVSEHIFVDDPLRLMRAVRFHHVLGLDFDESLDTLIRSHAAELMRAAPERVAAEAALTLSAGSSEAAFRLWVGTGLLRALLPESARIEREGVGGSGAGVGRSPCVGSGSEAGVGRNSEVGFGSEAGRGVDRVGLVGLTLRHLDQAIGRLPLWFPETASALSERLAIPVDGVWARPAALRLAVITSGFAGVEAAAAGRRLRLSADMVGLLQKTSAGLHEGWGGGKALERAARSPRSEVLFLWDASPWEPEAILLVTCAEASAAPSASVDPFPPSHVLEAARRLMDGWAAHSEGSAPPPPVDGDLLMQRFGITPGPRLGGILREVRLAWEAGEVTTAAEAIEVAERLSGGA